MSQFPPFHKHKEHFIFSIQIFFVSPLLFPCTSPLRCYCHCFIFPLLISKICHHYWENKAGNSLSFPVQNPPHWFYNAPSLLGSPNDVPCPSWAKEGSTGLHMFVNQWFLNTAWGVCLFQTTHAPLHDSQKLLLSSTWSARGHCFLPSLPNAQHKVTGCSIYIYIGLALFTSDTAKPFVSFSSQLHSLKLAPNTIFFRFPLLKPLVSASMLFFCSKYISFNRVFRTQGVSFYHYF